jgi:hypothetical protein
MSDSLKFIVFEDADKVNERLKSVDLNVLAEKRARRENSLYVLDSIGLQLFVSDLLRETFYKPE